MHSIKWGDVEGWEVASRQSKNLYKYFHDVRNVSSNQFLCMEIKLWQISTQQEKNYLDKTEFR